MEGGVLISGITLAKAVILSNPPAQKQGNLDQVVRVHVQKASAVLKDWDIY